MSPADPRPETADPRPETADGSRPGPADGPDAAAGRADAAGTPPPVTEPHEVFDRVGGMPAFESLVEAFYRRVAVDDVLRPMYPDDLEPGKRHLAMFFGQYWGGGSIYGDERGHPRLRMRHAPFPITPDAALRWAQLMTEAIAEQRFPPDVDALLLAYVTRATPTLINRLPEQLGSRPDVPPPGARPPDSRPPDVRP